MPKLAIQEDMLPGRTIDEQTANAKYLDLSGIEFWADGLTDRIPDVITAMNAHDMAACGVNLGRLDGYLYPDLETRELAISRMRQAMADAIDLEAEYVSFVPHYGAPVMPDLTPHQTPYALEQEMMIWLLRTISDLAYALGIQLYMQPINHYESHFMTRVDQAKYYRKKIKDHPHVKIAPNLFHMALEEDDINSTLTTHQDDIGMIYLSDHNRKLPGQGLIPFDTFGKTLKSIAYNGWLVLECGHPGHNYQMAYAYFDALPACHQNLKHFGII